MRTVLRHALRRRVFIPATGLLAAIFAAGVAWAYWSTTGSGTATATTGTLNPPTAVTASSTPGSGSASVSWTAPSGSVAATGYYVTRTSGSTTAAACGTSASSPISATSCTDSSVPDGSYTYTVVAVRASWISTSAPSSSVTVTSTRPDVTVNQAADQADPTNTSPIRFTATFSEPVTDFTAGKVTLGGTASGMSASVSGSGAAYTISVTASGTGTVTASIAANTVHDANGVGNTASTSTDNSVTYDVTLPTAPAPGVTAAVTSGTSPIYVNSETVTFTDAATDTPSGVASVRYYYCPAATPSCTTANGVSIGTSSTSGGGYAVSTAGQFAPEGPYKVVAVVTDQAGNASTSSPLLVTVDTTAPTVSRPTVNGVS